MSRPVRLESQTVNTHVCSSMLTGVKVRAEGIAGIAGHCWNKWIRATEKRHLNSTIYGGFKLLIWNL